MCMHVSYVYIYIYIYTTLESGPPADRKTEQGRAKQCSVASKLAYKPIVTADCLTPGGSSNVCNKS